MIVYPDSPRDRALFSSMPVVLVPKHDPLPPLARGHTRLLLAADGIYIEARTNVLQARGRIGFCPGLQYGPVSSEVTRLQHDDPTPLLSAAADLARRSLPNEWAGLVLKDRDSIRLHLPEAIDANEHRIRYDDSGIDPLDILWDIHSHGRLPAYFSSTDNRDDLMSPCPAFIASVIGNLDRSIPTWVTRLVISGRAFNLDDPTDGVHLRFLGCDTD